MSRDFQLYLKDIRAACDKINRYTAGMDFTDFMQNDMVYDAVMRNHEIIGEAAKNIPETERLKYPGIEWRKISGFRDILAHAYFGLDNILVWEVVHLKIPELNKQLS